MNSSQNQPFINKNNDLVIPFDCPRRYCWWDDFIPERMTIKEIRQEAEAVSPETKNQQAFQF